MNSGAEYKRGWRGRYKVRMYHNTMHVELHECRYSTCIEFTSHLYYMLVCTYLSQHVRVDEVY